MTLVNLKRTGFTLILAGLAGVAMTAVGMIETYKTQAGHSAPALAESIDSSLIPATIGSLLILGGLILVLMVWWRGREAKRSMGPRAIQSNSL